MSWLRALLIFTTGLTAAATALFIIGQVFFSWSWGGPLQAYHSNALGLVLSEFETYVVLLISVFAICVLKREETERTKVRVEHSTVSILLTVFRALGLIGAAFALLTGFSLFTELSFESSTNIVPYLVTQSIQSTGKSALFGLILLFAGRYLSHHPLVTQSKVEDTF